jgi:hypothetical protein
MPYSDFLESHVMDFDTDFDTDFASHVDIAAVQADACSLWRVIYGFFFDARDAHFAHKKK